jgi:hypothetical protein
MAGSLLTRSVAIAGPQEGLAMEDTFIECCCGLDVHQGSLVRLRPKRAAVQQTTPADQPVRYDAE